MDSDLLERRLSRSTLRLQEETELPLAFSGSIVGETDLALGNFAGSTVGALRGVHLDAGFGLGGRVMTTRHPMSVDDYVSSTSIRHKYDHVITAEGLRGMIAVPVLVRRVPIAILYAAAKTPMTFAGRMFGKVAEEARELEQQLAVDVALRDGMSMAHGGMGVEDLRDLESELQSIAGRITDPTVREELLQACSRIIATHELAGETLLTPRECDVIRLASRGHSNSAIAVTLGLQVNTVKSYMKSIMQKLRAGSRIEAAVIARSARLIP